MTVNHHSHPRCTVERETEQDRLLEFADPRLRVCIDVGISAFMDEDYIAQIRRYAPRTGYVHLKDWAFGKYCTLGQGTKGIDWARGPRHVHRDRLRRLGHRRAVVVRRHSGRRELLRQPGVPAIDRVLSGPGR